MGRPLLPNGPLPPPPTLSAEQRLRARAREAAFRQRARARAKREEPDRAEEEKRAAVLQQTWQPQQTVPVRPDGGEVAPARDQRQGRRSRTRRQRRRRVHVGHYGTGGKHRQAGRWPAAAPPYRPGCAPCHRRQLTTNLSPAKRKEETETADLSSGDAGAMGLEVDAAASSHNPYVGDSINAEDARKAITVYVENMKRAERTLQGTSKHKAEAEHTTKFLDTPFGKLAKKKLLDDGKVFVPLCSSEQEAKDTSATMFSRVGELVVKEGCSFKDRLKKFKRIKSQDRFMVPSNEVGGAFEDSSTEMGDTLRYVLRALDGSSYDQILTEAKTCLVSLENVGPQTLHRDQHLDTILKRLEDKQGASTRGNARCQPPPCSALCSFQEGTSLRGVDRSHLEKRKDYGASEGVDCPIPLGWGLLWHGLYVHGGADCSIPWHARLHMYLRVSGCSEAATGKIDFAEASSR